MTQSPPAPEPDPPPVSFDLTGRTAVVTGAGSGIGESIARGYAEAGARLLLWGRDEKVQRLAEQIEAAGGQAEAILTDLGDLSAASAMAEQITERHEVDILVNNAGTIERAAAQDVTPESWRRVTTVNLDAVWTLSRIFGAAMVRRGTGRIISIASMLSFQGGLRVSAYATSKHAIVGLTRALASEWAGSGVGVNAIAPGYIVTANTRALREDDQRREQITARIPAGRWGRPQDLTGPAIFLASDASAYVHGQVLAVDGGWLVA